MNIDYMYMKFTKIKNYFNSLKLEFDKASLHNKFYMAAITCLIVFIVIDMVYVLLLKQILNSDALVMLDVIAIFIAVLSVVAIVIEFTKILMIVYKEVWFKWLVGLITIFLYSASGLYMDDLINEYVKIDPGMLPVASTVLTLFFLIPCWLFVISIFIPFFIILGLFLEKTKSDNKILHSKNINELKNLTRIAGWFFIVITTAIVIDKFGDKNSFFASISRELILSSEYFKSTHCVNVLPVELSADIGRGYVSIYDIGSGIFRTEECQLKKSK